MKIILKRQNIIVNLENNLDLLAAEIQKITPVKAGLVELINLNEILAINVFPQSAFPTAFVGY